MTATINTLTKIDKDWVPLQSKVFTRWVTSKLTGPNVKRVHDISQDFSDGVALIELAEILTGKPAPRRWINNPKFPAQKVENCDLALSMLAADGVRLVGISGKDICDNNQKLILGLIWSLIIHYSITTSSQPPNKSNTDEVKLADSEQLMQDAKEALFNWAVQRTSNYPNVTDFEPYDLAMCGLLDSYFPDKINFYNLNFEDDEANLRLANHVLRGLGVPTFVYSEEFVNNSHTLDKKVLLTQLAAIKHYVDQVPTEKEDFATTSSDSDMTFPSDSSNAQVELVPPSNPSQDPTIHNVDRGETQERAEPEEIQENGEPNETEESVETTKTQEKAEPKETEEKVETPRVEIIKTIFSSLEDEEKTAFTAIEHLLPPLTETSFKNKEQETQYDMVGIQIDDFFCINTGFPEPHYSIIENTDQESSEDDYDLSNQLIDFYFY